MTNILYRIAKYGGQREVNRVNLGSASVPECCTIYDDSNDDGVALTGLRLER
jgi:hypothetical protein